MRRILSKSGVLLLVVLTVSAAFDTNASAQTMPTVPVSLPHIPDGEMEILIQRPETIKTELWVGADVGANSWFTYQGGTSSIFGGVMQPGWRLRAVAGYGQYSYDGFVPINNQPVETRIKGTVYTLEALLGYQMRFGAVVSKIFAGVDVQTHTLAPFDPRSAVVGEAYGVKIALENWITLGDRGFASLDGSWSSAFNSYWVQARAGFHVRPWLALGGEAALAGNDSYDAARAGALIKADTSYGSLMLSGGATGDIDQNVGFYSAASFSVRF